MRLLIGNFKGKQGDQGEEGPKGDTGQTGRRGSRWTSGTAITGTSTTGTKFPDSGITGAQLYDYYVNTDTGNLYECTVEGAADAAEWVCIGNIKGPTGDRGPAGSISDIDDQKPTYGIAAELANLESGETVKIAFGKLKKAVSEFITHYMNNATASILGHVKLSNSAAITTAGEYALDAVEKNASVAGTLANQIGQLNSNIKYTNLVKLGLSSEATIGNIYAACPMDCTTSMYLSNISILPDGGYYIVSVYKAWRGMIIADKVTSVERYVMSTGNTSGVDAVPTGSWTRVY